MCTVTPTVISAAPTLGPGSGNIDVGQMGRPLVKTGTSGHPRALGVLYHPTRIADVGAHTSVGLRWLEFADLLVFPGSEKSWYGIFQSFSVRSWRAMSLPSLPSHVLGNTRWPRESGVYQP